MATKYLTLAASGLAYALSYDEPDGLPTAPSEYSVPSYSLPTGGTTYECNLSADFTTALASAVAGDVIVLKAGFTYQGNFTVPVTDGSDWLYIISDSMASLPAEGTRVTGSDATYMPAIRSATYENPPLTIPRGATKVRIVGCQITSAHSNTSNIQYGLVRVGYGGSGTADNIVLDRCYIHAQAGADTYDGVVFYTVTNYALIDSNVSSIHSTGADESHGIHVYTAEGPGLIHNNYVEAAGQNIFIGDNSVSNVPKDITITKNHCFKPFTWWTLHPTYDSSTWKVKNIIEWKACSRCLCEGNVFEHNWEQSQTGVAVLFTPRGGAIADIHFKNNMILDVQSAWNINDADVTNDRILIENNLAFTTDTFTTYKLPDYFFFIAGTPGSQNDITIRHNTGVFIKAGANWHYGIIYFEGTADATTRLTFQDNLATHGSYGVFGDGGYEDDAAFARFCTEYTFDHNAQLSSPSAGGFTDTTFDNIPSDFALTGASSYHNAGSDGTDLGANMTQLASAISGVR